MSCGYRLDMEKLEYQRSPLFIKDFILGSFFIFFRVLGYDQDTPFSVAFFHVFTNYDVLRLLAEKKKNRRLMPVISSQE